MEILLVAKSRGLNCNALSYLGWVNIRHVISGVSGPKFTIFLFNVRRIVDDNVIYCLLIDAAVLEIFVVKVESCRKSYQICDVFCPPKF